MIMERIFNLSVSIDLRNNMSSFSSPHYMYLFEMKNGKQKLAYGASPEDALDILRVRLTEAEMEMIIKDKYIKISQRKMQEHIGNLG